MSASPESRRLVLEWLEHAEEDMMLARRIAGDSDISPRFACWHAHQAAEKALKALVLHEGGNPPRTHNLLALRALALSPSVAAHSPAHLAALSAWGIESRYPGDWDIPSQDDAVSATRTAERVLKQVRDALTDGRP